VFFISCSYENKNDPLICKTVTCLYISDLVVRKQHRGKGIGKQLMKQAEKLARAKKINYIKLIVYSKNTKAVEFYKEVGFTDYEQTMLKKL
jgi:ribosomal protein S18 acetylase RimI-like enzyme